MSSGDCSPFGQRNQKVLRAEGSCAPRRPLAASARRLPGTQISSVVLKKSRFHIVGQISSQNFMHHPIPQQRILQREQDFNALMQVPRHPVRAAQIHFRIATIFKIENAAVLQESSHDAAHSYTVAHAANSRTQSANSTYQQLDLDPRLRSQVERLDDILDRAANSSSR